MSILPSRPEFKELMEDAIINGVVTASVVVLLPFALVMLAHLLDLV